MTLSELLARNVVWSPTGQAEFPFAAEVGGRAWLIRLNDFPAESLYTLLVDGEEAGEFDDWPSGWRR